MTEFSYGDYECKGCGAIIDEDKDTILGSKDNFVGFKCSECNTIELVKIDRRKCRACHIYCFECKICSILSYKPTDEEITKLLEICPQLNEVKK